MSRHVAPHTGDSTRHVEYGFDAMPTPGYFALFVEQGESGEESSKRELDTREALAFDEHASRGEILGELENYDVPQEHVEALALDKRF